MLPYDAFPKPINLSFIFNSKILNDLKNYDININPVQALVFYAKDHNRYIIDIDMATDKWHNFCLELDKLLDSLYNNKIKHRSFIENGCLHIITVKVPNE